jgi:3-hydroxyisobutyrate dehydrogenase
LSDEEVRIVPPAAVGFIGLGQMGLPMTRRLYEAGYSLRACDASAAAREAFAQATGVTAVESAAEACRNVAAVITMLPNGAIVRQVLEQALAAAAPGTVVIDMSSSSPLETRALGEALTARGFPVVDAPVSGGVKRAIDGSLAIMAGGEAAVVERVRPLLEAMGKSVFATGPLGSGHAMKALNNYVSAAGLVAAAEAIHVGRHFGLDPEVMVDVLNASTGRNNSTEVKLKQHMLSGTFGSGFALGLMAKDLRTAAEIARHSGEASPLSQLCETLWAEADKALGPGADHTEIYRFLARTTPDRVS